MSTIRVKAAPGRLVPINARIATGADDRLLLIGEEPHDLPDVPHVRRRIRRGDLVVVAVTASPNTRAPRAVTLEAGGPPDPRDDLPDLDPKNPGPHVATPKETTR